MTNPTPSREVWTRCVIERAGWYWIASRGDRGEYDVRDVAFFLPNAPWMENAHLRSIRKVPSAERLHALEELARVVDDDSGMCEVVTSRTMQVEIGGCVLDEPTWTEIKAALKRLEETK